MTRFVASTDVRAPVEDVWARMTDWPAHGRWVPMTTVRVLTPLAGGVGARFVGRSSLAVVGLDVLGFDDPMEVTLWRPPSGTGPGRCEVRKLGRVVTGTAAFDVVPVPQDDGRPLTRVVWEEDIQIAPRALTRFLAPLVALAGRLAFTATLRTMGRELTARR
ncbi:SRPBCC family protein [Aquipuribacter sp. MA13-13]|uniref:SRPBCC family protein n=2 Tax=unclassified Aquipuribacter TaxID=2635084 RepID=UPI003EEACFD2